MPHLSAAAPAASATAAATAAAPAPAAPKVVAPRNARAAKGLDVELTLLREARARLFQDVLGLERMFHHREQKSSMVFWTLNMKGVRMCVCRYGWICFVYSASLIGSSSYSHAERPCKLQRLEIVGAQERPQRTTKQHRVLGSEPQVQERDARLRLLRRGPVGPGRDAHAIQHVAGERVKEVVLAVHLLLRLHRLLHLWQHLLPHRT